MLGLREFNNVFQQEAKKLYINMINANRIDELDDYSMRISDNLSNDKKVLILGYSQVSNNVLIDLCIDYGYKVENIDLITDKNSIKSFDCRKLKCKYYDLVIIGQLPHKMRNIHGINNNVLREINNNLMKYSNVRVATLENGKTRITKSSLEKIFVNQMFELSFN